MGWLPNSGVIKPFYATDIVALLWVNDPPVPMVGGEKVRQIVIDIETTGLDVYAGHRIIEIGCVELVNGEPTGNTWHQYLNPGFSQSPDVISIHGLSDEFLADKPVFEDVVGDFLRFLGDGELIIHHAPFDIGFLNQELRLALPDVEPLETRFQVVDTYAIAKGLEPDKRNHLFALAGRFDIELSGLAYTGALRDALLVAKIYKRLNAMKMNISKKLEQFARYAKERFDARQFACGDDGNARYIRVTASGLRVVSISDKFPCKELFKDGKAVPIRKDHASAICDLQDKDLHTSDKMGKAQPEHSLQAFIIRQALLDLDDKTSLTELLKIKAIVDELHFVADELKVADIRSDLIFVGKKGGKYFPVFMELKASRKAKELLKQLSDIEDYTKKYPKEFLSIFSAATGIGGENIDLEMAVRIAIWPASKVQGREANNLRGDRCFTIGYMPKYDFEWQA